MTYLAVSTIVRRAAPDEQSSYLRIVDLDRGRVVATVAMPESHGRAVDPNARGGHRGSRGVSACGERFVAAANDRLFVLDPSWRLAREMTHPWVGGIHDVLAVADGVWVTSTAASLLVKLDWEGRIAERWHWADDAGLSRDLGFRKPPGFDEGVDYRVPAYGLGAHDVVHMNAVIARGPGLLVSLGQIRSPAAQRWQGARLAATRAAQVVPPIRRAIGTLRHRRMRGGELRELPAPGKRGASHAIVELDLEAGHPGAARVLWHRGGVSTPKHNLGAVDGSLLFNDSVVGVKAVDLRDGDIAFEIPIPGSPTFARGLCALGKDEWAVGSQRPAAVYRVSLGTRSVIDAIELGGQPWETVYAICRIPAAFSRERVEGFAEWAAGLDAPGAG